MKAHLNLYIDHIYHQCKDNNPLLHLVKPVSTKNVDHRSVVHIEGHSHRLCFNMLITNFKAQDPN